jgi:hypothetical protein
VRLLEQRGERRAVGLAARPVARGQGEYPVAVAHQPDQGGHGDLSAARLGRDRGDRDTHRVVAEVRDVEGGEVDRGTAVLRRADLHLRALVDQLRHPADQLGRRARHDQQLGGGRRPVEGDLRGHVVGRGRLLHREGLQRGRARLGGDLNTGQRPDRGERAPGQLLAAQRQTRAPGPNASAGSSPAARSAPADVAVSTDGEASTDGDGVPVAAASRTSAPAAQPVRTAPATRPVASRVARRARRPSCRVPPRPRLGSRPELAKGGEDGVLRHAPDGSPRAAGARRPSCRVPPAPSRVPP